MVLPKLVIAGGSGFLGQLLVDWFLPRDWEVVVLTRGPAAGFAGADRRTGTAARWAIGRPSSTAPERWSTWPGAA